MSVSRRRVFLINKYFQFRFSAYVFGWVLAVSFVYPIIIYNLFSFFASYLQLDVNGPDLKMIEEVRLQVLTLLILFQILFMTLTFLVSIFMSHRIAGPIYKLTQFMQRATQGDFSTRLEFRQKDYFPEVANDFNLMINKIQEEFEKRDRMIHDAIADLENRNLDAALQRLRESQ